MNWAPGQDLFNQTNKIGVTSMKLLSPNKAADTLGISVKTVYRMINRGKLTRIKVESATRILEEEVMA